MNVKEIIKKLTIDEKISLLEGKDQWQTNNIERLDVQSLWLSDGPHGIRKEIPTTEVLGLNKTEKAVSLPTESTLACSFDKNLAYQYGNILAQEALSKEVDIVLGPGVNIKRNPLCGRNFEYYSEDPILSGYLARSVIKGIEDNNVGSCIKHFAANNQEDYRMTIDAIVDERTLREIYLKSFEICIKSGVASLMTSYNKVNGFYASENEHLISDILRNEWKYKGIVMTDWGGVNDRVRGLKAGCDLEMPSSYGYHSKKIKEAYLNGEVTTDVIDASCERILNCLNKYSPNLTKTPDEISATLEESHKKAGEIASQSSVLLKNESKILPLRNHDKVLFIGSLMKKPRYQGGGSSLINVYKLENVYDLIKNYTSNFDYCEGYKLDEDCYDKTLIDEAVSKAKNFNKIVLMLGLTEKYEAEGYDRKNLELPLGQLKLLEALQRVNKNIAVVVVSGGVVDLSFSSKVKGLLYSGLGGESGAKAILDNLYGIVNPSGRLAETFASKIEDYNTTSNFNKTNNATYYGESIYVGYRYFNTFNKKVVYPFGYGISYTTFGYSNLKVSTSNITKTKKIKVSVDVKNTGNLVGKEVVMVFVENNESKVFKAKRELKDFEKVELRPGEIKTVNFELDYNDFSYYDVNLQRYNVDSGTYKIQICKNVEEVILEASVLQKKEEEFTLIDIPNYFNTSKYLITDSDFEKLYGMALPSRNKEKVKVVTMEHTLEDVSDRFIGKVVKKIIFKIASDKGVSSSDEATQKTLERTLYTTPFKTIALYAGKDFPTEQFEGVIDILNYKFIKGIKKLKKGK